MPTHKVKQTVALREATFAAGQPLVDWSLAGECFDGKSLEGVSFLRCDLQHIGFADATLSGITFIECNLTGANFRAAKLTNVRFVQSECADMVFDGSVDGQLNLLKKATLAKAEIAIREKLSSLAS